LKNWNTP